MFYIKVKQFRGFILDIIFFLNGDAKKHENYFYFFKWNCLFLNSYNFNPLLNEYN